MRCLIILLAFFSVATFAQTTELQPTKCEECARVVGLSESYRDDSNHSLMVGYQYMNTWVIGKTAVSYTYVAGRTWSFELEYATAERRVEIGNFELGNIKEDRYTLFAKYFLTNSFHFSFGPYFYQYQIDTAGSLKNLAEQNFAQTWDLTGLGAAFAFGSRWQNQWGLTWGLDWVRMNYPLATTWMNKNTGEVSTTTRRDADNSFELLRNFGPLDCWKVLLLLTNHVSGLNASA
jgi:hypothetical protein